MNSLSKRRKGDAAAGASHKESSSVAYAGFSSKTDWSVPRLTGMPVAAVFYASFVSQRKPVVIDGLPEDETFAISAWAPAPMLKRCAEAKVYIEQRSAAGSFGTGRKELMSFRSFAAELARREDLYLTTQPVEEDAETGLPAQLYASPITEMRSRLPLRPALAGNLALSSVNLWLGRSAAGTSSNLHHDHHDNIYILLRGRKRFTLFPPSAGFRMYLHGRLSFVHRNGVLNYAGCATRDDGAMPHLALQWLRSRTAAGTASASGKKAAPSGTRGSAAEIAAAEAELAAAMARDAEYAAAVRGDGSEDSDESTSDDDGDNDHHDDEALSDSDGSTDGILSDASFDEDGDDGDDDSVGAKAEAKAKDKAAMGGKRSGSKKGSASSAASAAASAAAEADAMWAAFASAPAAAAASGAAKSSSKASKAAAPKLSGEKSGKTGGTSSAAAKDEADAMWAALSAESAGAGKGEAVSTAGKSKSKVKAKDAAAGGKKAAVSSSSSSAAAAAAADMWAALEAEAAAQAVKGKSASTKAASKAAKPATAASAVAAASDAPASTSAPVPVHFSIISMPELRKQLQAEDAAAGAKAKATSAAAALASAAAVGSKRRAADIGSSSGSGAEREPESEVARMRRLPDVASRFPLLADEAGAPSCTFELRAGQMLYLPAGWFHEVVSLNADDGDDDEVGAAAAAGGAGTAGSGDHDAAALEGLRRSHMALNYWFYPPSSAPGATFDRPYVDGYWAAVYKDMLRRTPGALPVAAAAAGSGDSGSKGKAKAAAGGAGGAATTVDAKAAAGKGAGKPKTSSR